VDEVSFVRDYAVMAAVFGFAGFIWFGWAQEDPPDRWRRWLGIGAVVGGLVAIAGGLLAWQNWGPESALAVPGAQRRFGIICGIEFGLAGLGALVFALTKRLKWTAPWVALIVGVHFAPLAIIFGDAGLFVLAALIVAAVGVSVAVHRRTGIALSATTGLGTGAILVVFGIRAAVLALMSA
jgi:hypothetical protein